MEARQLPRVSSTESLAAVPGSGVTRLPELHETENSSKPTSPRSRRPGVGRRNPRRNLVRALSFKMKDRWEEVDRGEHADSLVTALKARRRGRDITKKDVEAVLAEQYPGVSVRPTFKDMDDSVQISPTNGLPFGTGQWAEYYGGDAQWHLGLVRRVLGKAPVDYRSAKGGSEPKWQYSYNFGRGMNIPDYLVRAPEEALKRQFGMRPFVWHQWALLRVEAMTRFKPFHQRDFEELNFCFAAESLWEQWLHHPSNQDFYDHFSTFTPEAQAKLVQHLLSVFMGLDRLSKLNSPGSRWDFRNQNISVYSYPSLLGSGWMTCAVILTLQVVIPALLLIGALESSTRFDNFATSLDSFCPREIGRSPAKVGGLIMNILVILLYSLRIAPRTFDTFYQTNGQGMTLSSRLNALRKLVWNKGTDTLSMQLGYRLERVLKTCYMPIVCLIMLFTFFLSDSILDIVLNALAIEFVWQIDIDYAKSPYWDPTRRWIKAGAVECRIRATLNLEALNSAKTFCREYDISEEDYRAAFEGNIPSLRNAAIAAKDAQDPQYKTETDVVWGWAWEIAQAKNLANAQWQFSLTNRMNFGLLDNLLAYFGLRDRAMFRRFQEYRTWSLWEEVLFLSPVPSPDSIETLPRILKTTQDQLKKQQRRETRENDPESLLERPSISSFPFSEVFVSNANANVEYLNFDPTFHVKTPFQRFVYDVINTLLLKSMIRSVRLAYSKKDHLAIIPRVVDGLVEWVAHLLLVTFPILLLGYAILNILCY